MSHLDTFSDQSTSDVASVTFTVPAAATYALVACGMRGGAAATTLDSVTMGGESFTLDNSTMRRFDVFQGIEFGYMLAADLPSGSVTAEATRGGTTGGFTIVVSFFDDALQSAPLLALNGASSSPSDPFATSISPSADAVLSDMILSGATGTDFAVQETGQTETSDEAVGANSLRSFTSIRAVSSGSNDMSWDIDGYAFQLSHVIAAIETAGGGGGGPVILRRRIEGY